MSSLKWPKTQQKGGIFIADQDVSPFAAANKAFVPYCSSDAFLGNSAATDNHLGLHFRGQALVEGSIRTLVSEHGLGPGHTLVFGGCSAGGRGAMFTLDYLPAMLPTGVTLLGLFDAVLWIDGFDSRMLHQTKTILELTNATARLGTKCLEVYGSTSERWKCMFGQHRVGLVEQPFLVSTSQYDTFQLVTKLGHPPPWTDAQVLASCS